MDKQVVLTGLLWFGIGLVFSSFVEYWAHRVLHQWRLVGKTHRDHHARNEGQGVLWEYLDYVKPSSILMIPPFFVSLPAGIGFFIGSNLYALFSAYSHQLQHENPAALFWMPMPTHYVHHEFNMWHYNFGMAVDIWDRVFRTYKRVEWRERIEPQPVKRGLLNVRWW
jgi:sterol desaturase/sphingolipid hydroxylase (fatty acid hydroxylase superfamily)